MNLDSHLQLFSVAFCMRQNPFNHTPPIFLLPSTLLPRLRSLGTLLGIVGGGKSVARFRDGKTQLYWQRHRVKIHRGGEVNEDRTRMAKYEESSRLFGGRKRRKVKEGGEEFGRVSLGDWEKEVGIWGWLCFAREKSIVVQRAEVAVV
ncbi:unnamed protein product [Linum trigynum]|uniref:Uncharacterized protein n=1 Tax=Linum trigynum TaxID=586398 RepID=A0AAV2ETU6_9ROSI